MGMEFPGYLATMPLHAITEVYGEPGLRERFLVEIRRFTPDIRADVLRELRRPAGRGLARGLQGTPC